MTLPAPFKVCIPSRGKARIGIAAYSYDHLREVLRQKYGVSGDFFLQLGDGTLVCDEDYFKLLEPNTSLTVVELESSAVTVSRPTSNEGPSLGSKRPVQAEPDSASALLPKQPHLEHTAPAQTPAQFAGCIDETLPHNVHPQGYIVQSPTGSVRPRPPLVTMHQVFPPQYHVTTTPAQRYSPASISQDVSSSSSGMVSLPINSAMQVTAGLQQPLNSSANNNASLLVSQLQIANVMGNVSMSPPSPSPVRTSPPPLQQANSSCFGHFQPMPQQVPWKASPIQQVTHSASLPGRFQPVPQQLPRNALYSMPITYIPPAPPYSQAAAPQCYNPYISQAGHMHPYMHVSHYPSHTRPMSCQQAVPTQRIVPQMVHPGAQLPLRFSSRAHEEYQEDLARLERHVALVRRQQQQLQAKAISVIRLPTPPRSANTPAPAPATPSNYHQSPTGNSTALQTCQLVNPRSEASMVSILPQESLQIECVPNVIEAVSSHESVPCRDSLSSKTTGTLPSGATCVSEDSSTVDSRSASSSLVFTLSLPPTPIQVPPTLLSNESPATETQKLSTVEVVCCPSNASLPDCDCDEDENKLCIDDSLPDGDCDEDENKPCIDEQASLPMPEPPTSQQESSIKKKPKPTALPLAAFSPFVHQSLGDAKYPITNAVSEACFPDEGYSSSSSPYDTAQEFSSQLPFANYDKFTSVETRENKTDHEDENAKKQTDLLRTMSDAESEQDEEDFDMDIDVFLPLIPEWRPLCTQPPLPDYLPLELEKEVEPTEESATRDVSSCYPDEPSDEYSKETMLIVSIRRDSLSSSYSSRSFSTSSTSSNHGDSSDVCSVRSFSTSALSGVQLKTSKHLKKGDRFSDAGSSRNSTSSASSGLWCKYSKHKHKRRKRKRSHFSAPDSSYTPPTPSSRPSHLMVRIPIYHCNDDSVVCAGFEEDDTDDSDEPTTTMELLAARLEEAKEAKRLPQIIHLEPHLSGDEDLDAVHCESPETVVEIAEYCSEVNVLSVCSAEDMTNCLKDLASLHHRTNCLGNSGESVVSCLDVGDEIELGGLSQESGFSTEMTGMELLNLRNVQRPPLNETTENYSSSRPQQCTTSVSNESCAEEKLQPKTWKVHSLIRTDSVFDPRQRVQRYSLGGNTLFELSCTSGNWRLDTF